MRLFVLSLIAHLCCLWQIQAGVKISGNIEEPAAFMQENGLEQAPIKFYITYLVEEREFTAVPDKYGYFTIRIPLLQASNGRFEYVDQSGELFLLPGDDLHIRFKNGDCKRTLRYMGKGSEHCNFLADFQRVVDLEKQEEDLHVKRQTLSQSAYNLHCDNLQTRELAILEAYLDRHRTSNLFRDWIEAEIKYRCANRIHKYYFRSIDRTKDDYRDFVSQYPFNATKLLTSKQYRLFLEYHLRNLTMRDEVQMGLVKSGSEQPWVIRAYQLSSKEFTGQVLDYALANLVIILLDAKHDSSESLYLDFINRPSGTELKAILMERFKPVQKAFTATLPVNANLTVVGKDNELRLQEILNTYIGKVIYIDFWAGWCKPCLAEMPASVMLQREYADKEVVFLYFSQDFTYGTWRDNIAKLQISGEHYLMDKPLRQETADEYLLVELPRYILLDKFGNVAHEFAKRPSSSQIRGDINALLGE